MVGLSYTSTTYIIVFCIRIHWNYKYFILS